MEIELESLESENEFAFFISVAHGKSDLSYKGGWGCNFNSVIFFVFKNKQSKNW